MLSCRIDDSSPSIVYDINPDKCCNGRLLDYVKVKKVKVIKYLFYYCFCRINLTKLRRLLTKTTDILMISLYVTAVMIMTFSVTMLTTPHNLALGVISGVALAGILFSRKVAKVIRVEAKEIDSEQVIYEVTGQLFFVSKVYFLQGFDIHSHPRKVTIDMRKAHIWDQSGVNALDQIIRKISQGGSEVDIVGLNEESLDLFERLGGQEMSHG